MQEVRLPAATQVSTREDGHSRENEHKRNYVALTRLRTPLLVDTVNVTTFHTTSKHHVVTRDWMCTTIRIRFENRFRTIRDRFSILTLTCGHI